MKRIIISIVMLVVFSTLNQLFAQPGSVSVGVMTSWQNFQSGNTLTGLNNSSGVGILFRYHAHERVSFQFTGIRSNGTLGDNQGTESHSNGNISIVYNPVVFGPIRPYFSGGFGYISSRTEIQNTGNRNNNNMYTVYGAGADVFITHRINLNFEIAYYNDLFGFVGNNGNLGVRINL